MHDAQSVTYITFRNKDFLGVTYLTFKQKVKGKKCSGAGAIRTN